MPTEPRTSRHSRPDDGELPDRFAERFAGAESKIENLEVFAHFTFPEWKRSQEVRGGEHAEAITKLRIDVARVEVKLDEMRAEFRDREKRTSQLFFVALACLLGVLGVLAKGYLPTGPGPTSTPPGVVR